MQHHMHDLVCGMTVEPEHGAGTEVYHGTTYTCCSPHCLEKFRADPAQYVTPGHVHETHGSAPGVVRLWRPGVLCTWRNILSTAEGILSLLWRVPMSALGWPSAR